jgi:hypothetical protein
MPAAERQARCALDVDQERRAVGAVEVVRASRQSKVVRLARESVAGRGRAAATLLELPGTTATKGGHSALLDGGCIAAVLDGRHDGEHRQEPPNLPRHRGDIGCVHREGRQTHRRVLRRGKEELLDVAIVASDHAEHAVQRAGTVREPHLDGV